MRLMVVMLLCLLSAAALAACAGSPDDDDAAAAPDDDTDDDQSVDDDTLDDDAIDDDAVDDDLTDDDTADDDVAGPFCADFERYWHTLDERYAYFIEKNIDWDAVYSAQRDAACAEVDVAAFQLRLAAVTAALGDSHTWSSLNRVPAARQPARDATGVCLQRDAAGVHLSHLTAEAQSAGLWLGDRVVALDGEAVDAVLARARSWEGCSTDQCCDRWVLPYVDRYARGPQQVVYTVERDGEQMEIPLARNGSAWYGTCQSDPLREFLADAAGTYVHAKPIGDDLAYVQLTNLNDGYQEAILRELDAALAAFADRDGLVFDVRDNHGGSDLVAMAVLARFLGEVIWPVHVRYKLGPAHDSFTPWIPEPILPGLAPTSQPVVLLVNGGCLSAADFFVAGASLVPSFTLLGTTSCGGTGAPDHDVLPISQTTYYFSQMQRRYVPTWEQIEGRGIDPDIVVEPDPADLAAGIDTQLAAAIAWLRAGR